MQEVEEGGDEEGFSMFGAEEIAVLSLFDDEVDKQTKRNIVLNVQRESLYDSGKRYIPSKEDMYDYLSGSGSRPDIPEPPRKIEQSLVEQKEKQILLRQKSSDHQFTSMREGPLPETTEGRYKRILTPVRESSYLYHCDKVLASPVAMELRGT
ncbi:unnamed protein product [Psylliodes chrysocephalus]|uniref:Uncharacterized protein n=1 Tax=Psylliodes chrysocephalus TaxID=3402493 RepID=A0A9P0CSA2_9CUCU|nr:unnamed protein product [Psylliodes chrysocephala]